MHLSPFLLSPVSKSPVVYDFTCPGKAIPHSANILDLQTFLKSFIKLNYLCAFSFPKPTPVLCYVWLDRIIINLFARINSKASFPSIFTCLPGIEETSFAKWMNFEWWTIMHLTWGCGRKGQALSGVLWGIPSGWDLFDMADAGQ